MQPTRRHRIIAIVSLLFLAWCVLSVPTVIKLRDSRELQHKRHVKITADIRTLRSELNHFKLANRVYPSTEQGLRMLASGPEDPWGSAYIYRFPGIRHPDGYDLFSAGGDKMPDTFDDDWGD